MVTLASLSPLSSLRSCCSLETHTATHTLCNVQYPPWRLCRDSLGFAQCGSHCSIPAETSKLSSYLLHRTRCVATHTFTNTNTNANPHAVTRLTTHRAVWRLSTLTFTLTHALCDGSRLTRCDSRLIHYPLMWIYSYNSSNTKAPTLALTDRWLWIYSLR